MDGAVVVERGPGCEWVADGPLVEPVSAVTSWVFVLAALVVVVRRRRAHRPVPVAYVALVAGVGVGSFVQHGPDPAWSDAAHDLPLAGVLCFLAADAAGVLSGRARRWWWWAVPTGALMVPVVVWPRAGDLAQVGVAVVAALLLAWRASRVPAERARVAAACALLAAGGTVGALSRTGGPWCDPSSLLQGHAVWHVAAAAALVVLAPLVTPDAPLAAPPSPGRASMGR
ncbi:hypothetical protein [Cellulomonas sp. SLBN-39]|uniref:hypothetical protein n=1 Tax=Cellulomonas sp. SLBN-39 TaxID=2768446 RepID=UPI00117108AC|nr:hypothetical protein [Cellulomonas sp. SLBN-39]TQL02625.1 hypothetical protein FBY24_1705 [Cellulomonas sp. SLBN-39]